MKNKGNDGKGNNQDRDDWETNQQLFDILNNQYHFTFDCCANKKNKKTELYSNHFKLFCCPTLRDHICWMNPPFSKAKEMFQHFFCVVYRGVAIYRADNFETSIWQDIIFENATWIHIPRGRIAYTSFDFCRGKGKGTRFPSALIGLNIPEPPKWFNGFTLNTI